MKILEIIYRTKIGMWFVTVICMICLSIAFQTKIAYIYEVGYFTRYVLASVVIVLALLMFIYELSCIKKTLPKKSLKSVVTIFIAEHNKFLKISMLFIVPYILMGLYTAFLYLLRISDYIYIGRTISSVGGLLITILCAVSVMYIFKRNSFKLLFSSILLSYVIQVVFSLKIYGVECIKQIYNSIFTDNANAFNIFEVHDLTFTCGIILLTVLYLKKKNIKINSAVIVFLTIFIIAGYKRIQFLALVLVLAYIIAVKLITEHFNISRKTIYTITGIGIICISLIFIWMIDSGTLSLICNKIGINTHDRIHFYEWSNQYFDLSITYPGIGSGAITKLMSLYNPWGIWFDVSSLHSDILRTYIDVGFIGFILVEYYYLIYIYKYLCKRINEYAGNCYFIIQLYLFILHFTDNTFTYFATQTTLIIVTCYISLYYCDIKNNGILKVILSYRDDAICNNFNIKKTASVISIYDVDNYGNRLQNYAVKRILEKRNILVINYKNVVGQGFVRKVKSFLIDFYLIRKAISLIKNGKYGKKYENGYNFSEKYTEPTPFYVATQNYNLAYSDYYIVGSDQVWNPEFQRLSKLDLLTEVNCGKKISLAASFGVSSINNINKDILKESLNKFDYISVREDSGSTIISEILGKKPYVLVDPTMMLSAEEWSNIEKKVATPDEGYVLTYFLGNITDERMMAINNFADKNGCKVIHLGKRDFTNYYSSGPDEFIYLIHHANYICTDSFHACVFSLIFKRPFIAFTRYDNKIGDMTTRLSCLLKQFNINQTLINDNELIEPSYDYEQIEKILSDLQCEFNKFLDEALL